MHVFRIVGSDHMREADARGTPDVPNRVEKFRESSPGYKINIIWVERTGYLRNSKFEKKGDGWLPEYDREKEMPMSSNQIRENELYYKMPYSSYQIVQKLGLYGLQNPLAGKADYVVTAHPDIRTDRYEKTYQLFSKGMKTQIVLVEGLLNNYLEIKHIWGDSVEIRFSSLGEYIPSDTHGNSAIFMGGSCTSSVLRAVHNTARQALEKYSEFTAYFPSESLWFLGNESFEDEIARRQRDDAEDVPPTDKRVVDFLEKRMGRYLFSIFDSEEKGNLLENWPNLSIVFRMGGREFPIRTPEKIEKRLVIEIVRPGDYAKPVNRAMIPSPEVYSLMKLVPLARSKTGGEIYRFIVQDKDGMSYEQIRRGLKKMGVPDNHEIWVNSKKWMLLTEGMHVPFGVDFAFAFKEGNEQVIQSILKWKKRSEKTILVVDDDRKHTDFDKKALTEVGYKVVVADDGLSASRILNEMRGNIAAVVCDLIMSDLPGDALLKSMREVPDFSKIPFILRSYARSSLADALIAGYEGVSRIHKSRPSDELVTLVDKHVIGDSAMSNPGGIDLTAAKMNLQMQNAGEGIKFHLDPAMLQQFQNAPGFVPVIINIQPMRDLRAFLGVPTS
jgi:CheY-like chemotaxis protein